MQQDSDRWTVFRYASSVHRILTVDGGQQQVKGNAPPTAGEHLALVDCSTICNRQLAAGACSCVRTVRCWYRMRSPPRTSRRR